MMMLGQRFLICHGHQQKSITKLLKVARKSPNILGRDLRKRCINLHSIKIKEEKDPQKFHLDLSRSFFCKSLLHEKGSFSSFHPTPNRFVTPFLLQSHVPASRAKPRDTFDSIQGDPFVIPIVYHVYPLPRTFAQSQFSK